MSAGPAGGEDAPAAAQWKIQYAPRAVRSRRFEKERVQEEAAERVRRGNPTPAKARAALIAIVVLALSTVAAGGGRAGAQGANAGGGTDPAPPKVEAEAWALADADTGLYLTGENPDERLPVAATAIVMTALVALREVEAGDAKLEDEVTISKKAESYVGTVYSNVGLISGETVTLRDLLVASLVPSGTDAVYAMAEHLGNGAGEAGVDAFVARMNRQARAMGLRNTRFDNPAGLDSPGNYSSARDLAEIGREAMAYPEFAEIVGQTSASIGTNDRKIEVFTTNGLLSTYPLATGVKTGTSPEAGPSLVASAEGGGESYVAVVLDAGSEDGTPGDRFEDARSILEHGFARYEREALVARHEKYGELPLPYRGGESVELVATENVFGPVDAGGAERVERRVRTEKAPPSARAGEELGDVEVLVGGRRVGQSPLVAREGYAKASPWEKARQAIRWPAGRLWSALRDRL